MKNVSPYLIFLKRSVYLFDILNKEPTRAAGKKDSTKVYKHVKIPVHEFTTANEKSY